MDRLWPNCPNFKYAMGNLQHIKYAMPFLRYQEAFLVCSMTAWAIGFSSSSSWILVEPFWYPSNKGLTIWAMNASRSLEISANVGVVRIPLASKYSVICGPAPALLASSAKDIAPVPAAATMEFELSSWGGCFEPED